MTSLSLSVSLFHFFGLELIVDLSSSVLDELASEPATPPTRTSEALRSELRNVNNLLDRLKCQWQAEKQTLLGDKAALQDATNRLSTEYRAAQEQVRKHQRQEDAAAGINTVGSPLVEEEQRSYCSS